MIPSWYPIVEIFGILAYLASIILLALIAAGAIWASSRLWKPLASVSQSLEETKKAIASLPEVFAKIEKVTSELHDLQEGQVRVLQRVEKAIRDLVGTIEEFEGMLVKPKERPQRIQATNESDEMAAERRRQEREGAVDLKALEEVGKHVGTV